MTRLHTHNSIASHILRNARKIDQNAVAQTLAGCARQRGEVEVTPQGAVVATTGKFTGRSAGDKYILRDNETEHAVWWDNANAMAQDQFDQLLVDMLAEMPNRPKLFNQQLFAGADPENRFEVDVFTDSAWHALFIRHLLIRPRESDLQNFDANVTVLHLPGFQADPARHGTKTTTAIALDFTRNIILICGTFYAGEIKKSVFSLFNYHAPARGILPMHCSANVGQDGDTTLFFGLSGTGKTTLSTSAERALVGDDEHGWSDNGVFNLEGGCYAKAIDLTEENEPEIFNAAMQPHTVLENVTFDADTGELDFTDKSVTENTRIAYPLTAIPNRVESGLAPAPKNIVLLTADAFGVLPPIARLTPEQAIVYFLSGYTAKVAGTERGVTEPQATFSACFGAPFMARHPAEYGKLLAKKIGDGEVNIWLLNTGWTGGRYGVGKRMALKATRRMLEAALSGGLDDTEFVTDQFFDLSIPTAVEGVDATLLDPSKTWADQDAYAEQAKHLVGLFEANLKKLGPQAQSLIAGKLPNSNAA